MKVLWLCNIMLPKISASLGMPVINGGGWLTGLSNDLLQQSNYKLTVCFLQKFSRTQMCGYTDKMEYYGFYEKQKNIEAYFTQVIKSVAPDVVHIWGTELPYSLYMVNACEKLGMINKVVVSIQGLVSVYARHFIAGLPEAVVHGYSMRDLIKLKNIHHWKKEFALRGKYEIKTLQKVKHIIGRTDWDKACASQINTEAVYHFCNETLRDEFYKYKWDIENCEKHSIFISQCHYPIKGFHFLLEALPEILKHYPDIHVYTTGKNPLLQRGTDRFRQTYYHKYLGKLIKKYSLTDHVTFLGSLDEKGMCQCYLKSHVFVSASSIENSPNSVGEAMILGVPTVSSDVGGIKNMLTHNEEGYIYQYDAPYMLAYYIMKIFNDDDLAIKLSQNARCHALNTHSRQDNLKQIIQIYGEIK